MKGFYTFCLFFITHFKHNDDQQPCHLILNYYQIFMLKDLVAEIETLISKSKVISQRYGIESSYTLKFSIDKFLEFDTVSNFVIYPGQFIFFRYQYDKFFRNFTIHLYSCFIFSYCSLLHVKLITRKNENNLKFF